MIIGYDAKRAVNNSTGLGNYSRLVVDMLSLAFPENSYRLYAPRRGTNANLAPLLERDNVELVTPDSAIGRRFGGLWRSAGITHQLMRDEVDLFHGLSNELPLNIGGSDIATVVTIHDIIFRRIPAAYKPIDRSIYDFKFSRACRIADRVIAVSERTKADIVEDYGVSPEKVDVIYQGCHPQFYLKVEAEARAAVRAKYSLPERYVISVGTVEMRKNQLLAVKALRALPEDIKMVIVGRRTSYAKEIDEYAASKGLSERVVFLSGVPFADLPALYSAALFSTYTSRYEGFGIPVVESLASGVPVIACTGSCLEEAGGKGAVYVNPDDEEAMAENARRLAEYSYLRDKLLKHGQSHIKKFTNSEFARLTMASYNKAILEKLLK